MLKKLSLYLALVRYSRAHNRDFAREHCEFFTQLVRDLQPRIGDLRGRRVLDVGCGKSAWLSLLLHSAGANVTGIDTEVAQPGRSLGKYIGLLRRNGVDRALRTFAWDLLYAGPYYRALGAHCSFPLRFEGLDLRTMSVTAPDLPPRSFDLIVSHEVLEHLPDIPGTARALAGVLRPGGLTYIYVHNFASISGGHHLAWKYPDTEPSEVVPPWDHLRQRRFPEIPSWINGVRERDYRRAFEEWFEILEWKPGVTEGQALLTSDIRAELAEYGDAELLTKGFTIIARPKV